MSAALSPPCADPWGSPLVRRMMSRVQVPDDAPPRVPATRRHVPPPVSRARRFEEMAAGPSTGTTARDHAKAVLQFLWASLRGVLSVPFIVLTLPVLLVESVVTLVGTVLSFLHLTVGLLVVAVLPRPLARRAIFVLVPSVGSFWKVELLLDPIVNFGERIKVPQNLTMEPEYGAASFAVRTVFGYVLFVVARTLQLIANAWAFGVEQTVSMIRYLPGGLAYGISPHAFRPVTHYLWAPLMLGQYTSILFADEDEQGRPGNYGLQGL